jgi:hypothetical protein
MDVQSAIAHEGILRMLRVKLKLAISTSCCRDLVLPQLFTYPARAPVLAKYRSGHLVTQWQRRQLNWRQL